MRRWSKGGREGGREEEGVREGGRKEGRENGREVGEGGRWRRKGGRGGGGREKRKERLLEAKQIGADKTSKGSYTTEQPSNCFLDKG